MPLRQFGPQKPPRMLITGKKRITWLELKCPVCDSLTCIQGRGKRLARTGSQQEFTSCAGCGVKLTLGKLVTYPNGHKSLKERFQFWRRESAKTLVIEESDG